MARTATTIEYNGYTSVLLRYDDGQQALWVQDDYLAGKAAAPGVYSLNDVNWGNPLDPGEEIDVLIAEWQQAVEWDSPDA